MLNGDIYLKVVAIAVDKPVGKSETLGPAGGSSMFEEKSF